MRVQIGDFPGAIVETVTRYIGYEVSLTADFADDVGLDSIDRLNLMTAVEQAHDVELSDEEIATVSTLQDLLSLLQPNSGKRGIEAGENRRESVKPPTGGHHENP